MSRRKLTDIKAIYFYLSLSMLQLVCCKDALINKKTAILRSLKYNNKLILHWPHEQSAKNQNKPRMQNKSNVKPWNLW